MKIYITGHKGFVGRELLKRGFLPLVCNVTNPFEQQGFAPRPHYGGLDTNLAFELGLPKRNYFDGIDRMIRYEN